MLLVSQCFLYSLHERISFNVLQVIIDDIEMGVVFEFPCSRWFAKDEDDGQISRELILNIGATDATAGNLP